MTPLLRISEAAALALHTVQVLAAHPERRISTQQIAEQLAVSEHHLAKVHQRLVRAGILEATRGPGGGFALARDAAEIRLIEVYEAVEGPLTTCRCLLGRPVCARSDCLLGALSDQINRLVGEFLRTTTVAALTA